MKCNIRAFALSMFTLLLLAQWAGAFQAEPIKFPRYPHIAHGKITFSYHGDIWVADQDGANPYRLTAHIGQDRFPRFSPDGRYIAFSSNRMGNDDIYVVPTVGGTPRRITSHTTGDQVQYWTPDGTGLVMSTSRAVSPWGSPLYRLAVDGERVPVPLPMDRARSGMIKQDGTMVAFNRNGFNYARKGYRGNSQTNVWVQDLRSNVITKLTDLDVHEFREHGHDADPMWGADGMIYFASERDGTFNIWKIAPTGGEPVQLTRHTQDGVKYPAISPDGRTIIYENEFELWKVDIADGRPERIPIPMGFDYKTNLVEFISTSHESDGFSPSPDGSYVVVDFQGEIFIVPTEEGVGEMTQVTSSDWRERRQIYSPDGKYLAYISDETGDEEIWVYETATGQRRQLSRHPSLKSDLLWAHDSSRIAYTGSNRLFMTEVANGRTTELGYNQAGGYTLTDFSRDGKWLVYHRADQHQRTNVYLFEIATGAEHDLTRGLFRSSGGLLTPDQSAVVFTSNRDSGTNHLFKVPLRRLREDPDDPLVRERRQSEQAAQREARGDAEPAIPPLQIDTEGIDRRAIQLTRGSNGVSNVFLSNDGRTIYYVSTDDRGRGLFSMTIEGRNARKLTDGAFTGLTPTSDGRTVFYREGRQVHKMALANRTKQQVRFNFTVTVDRRARWLQMFQESWRIMKYRFYDEDMHGVDWDAVRRTYEPMVAHVGQNQDLYDLVNRVFGELNASHLGISGPGDLSMPSTYRTRFLGFEMEPEGDRFKITHIYRDGPADREWFDLQVGEYVLAIDGQPVEGNVNYWPILNATLNEYVTVTVAARPDGRNSRQLRVRTVASLNNIKYEEWVAGNRDYVERESGGRLAYVHIRSMNQSSLERFRNEVNHYWDAEGLIIDIRYNGGGNTDQEILDILKREPYQFWNNRWGHPSWGRRWRQAIAGPKVMLINFRSGSDSEVTPLGFRDLELGSLVGNPTAGAVIATGSYRLINGGSIRTPGSLVVQWDPTRPNNWGINLENYGVAPDVWAVNTPEDELRGFDRELKAAIDEGMRMLRERVWRFDGDDRE